MMQKINKRCSNKNTFIHKLPDKIPEIVRNISVCYNSFIKNITICSRTSINIIALTMADTLNIKDRSFKMVSVGTPCNVYVSILFLESPYYRLQ